MTFARSGLAFLAFGIVAMSGSAFCADGKGVYDKTCVVCHASGVANAPKLGDKAAWAPRIATGRDALIASVVKGKGAMPPKAGAANLSDDEIKAAVEYLIGAAK
jgi:cytochrome c5